MSEFLRILTRSMKTSLFRMSFLFTVIIFGFICMPRREIKPPGRVFSRYPVKIEKITSGNGIYKARINNKTVKAGGITGIYTVKSIREGEVVLEAGGKTLTFEASETLRNAVLSKDPVFALNVSINAPCELDFLSKDKIYEMRRSYASQYPGMIDGASYKPFEYVFGPIEDGKPWVGLSGATYYKSDIMLAEGDSLASIFIANPLMLAGLSEIIWNIEYEIDKQMPPAAIFPEPVKFLWGTDGTCALLRYDMTKFSDLAAEYGIVDALSSEFITSAVNARDFGFTYCGAESTNLSWYSRHYLVENRCYFGFRMVGRSGVPEGGYNSAMMSVFSFSIKRLPAKIIVSFWKKEPIYESVRPDFILVMEFI